MLAVIGGTGLYEMEDLEVVETHAVETPFGKPSSDVIKGVVAQKEILFLARHGAGHRQLPYEINCRVNIFALKFGIATDYDCWMDDPSKHMTANGIFALYASSLAKARRLLPSLLIDDLPAEEPDIRTAMSHA